MNETLFNNKRRISMGQIIIQKIFTCDLCGKTPEVGEKLWFMCNDIWCEECCEKMEKEEK